LYFLFLVFSYYFLFYSLNIHLESAGMIFYKIQSFYPDMNAIFRFILNKKSLTLYYIYSFQVDGDCQRDDTRITSHQMP